MNSRRLGATHFRKNMLNLAPPPPIKKNEQQRSSLFDSRQIIFDTCHLDAADIEKVEQDFNRTMYNTL